MKLLDTTNLKFSHFRLMILMPLLTGLVIIVVAVVGIIPGVEVISISRKKLADRRGVSAALSNKAQILESLDRSLLERNVALMIDALGVTVPYQATLGKIMNLSSRHQVSITQMQFSGIVKSPLELTLEVVGDFNNLEAFIRSVANSLPLMSVKDVTLSFVSAPDEAETLGIYRLSLIVGIYFSHLPESIGKASEPLPDISRDLENKLTKIRDYENFRVTASRPVESDSTIETLFPP